MGKFVPPTLALIGAAFLVAAAPIPPTKTPPQPPRIGIDTSFGGHVDEARRLFRLGHFREAIGKVDLALAMQPDDKNAALLYALRGDCFWDLDANERALADYNEAVRRDPKVPGVRGRKGILECNSGSLRAAIDDLTAALRERQQDPAYFYYARAIAYATDGKHAEAQEDFDKVRQLPPRGALGYLARGEAFLRSGDAASARRDFAVARRLDPSSVFLFNSLAWWEATLPEPQSRNGKAAVRDATRACELEHWKDPDTLDTLAAAYAESGDFRQALIYEHQAITLETRSAARKILLAHLSLFQKEQPVREEFLLK